MTSTPTSVQLVRLLAEENRRRVVAALVLADGACGPEALAEATGLTLRDVIDSLDRLTKAGVVGHQSGTYLLLDDVFGQAARAEIEPAKPSEHDDQPTEIARVLDVAFRDGRLVQWPSKRSKRLIVLDYLAQQFDIGVHYTEQEVNDRLRAFDDDVATTRRYLVDAQFLDRGDGEYWRCGGSI